MDNLYNWNPITDEIYEPCPFCGCEADLVYEYSENDEMIVYSVKCRNIFCGCRTGLFQYPSTAINVWNRRT